MIDGTYRLWTDKGHVIPNGGLLKKEDYPLLYAVIGETYGFCERPAWYHPFLRREWDKDVRERPLFHLPDLRTKVVPSPPGMSYVEQREQELVFQAGLWLADGKEVDIVSGRKL